MKKQGSAGVAAHSDFSCEYNQLIFTIRRVMSRINVGGPVQVVGVRPSGLNNQVGYLDVQPLINQIDGFGQPTPSGVLYNLVYFRLQAGSGSIVIDPQVGDIGFAVYADRDMSAVKRTQARANPGSRRRFDVADGVYFGGMLNGAPTEFLQFDPSSGERLSSQIKIQLDAPQIDLVSPLINLSSWVGLIAPFGMGAVPQGWLACPTAQTLVSTSTYQDLFNAIGYTWGGSGASFGLPFFEPNYVPLAGVAIGAVAHGVVKDHTHDVPQVSGQTPNNNTYGTGTATNYDVPSTRTTYNPNSPEGGPDNLAAGRGVQWCVKY